MAGKITGMVLDHFHGDPLAKLVFLTLADRANEDALCWPSRGDICARSGASVATVTRKLRLLEAEGWIARRQRFQTSVVFRINVPRLLMAAAVAERFRSIPKGFDPFPEEIAAQAIEKKDDDHGDHKNDHCEPQNDHLGDHVTVKEPFKEPRKAASAILKEKQGAELTGFQKARVAVGQSLLIGGKLVQAGSPEMAKLRQALNAERA